MNRTLAKALLAGVVCLPTLAYANGNMELRPAETSDPLVMTPTFGGSNQGAFAPLYAEEAAAQPAVPTPPPAKKVSGSFSSTLTSKYISRGLILNNSGAIVQLSAELDFDLYSSKEGAINSISPYIGLWSDLTDNRRFAKNNLAMWYEFDWDAGVSVTFLNSWNFNIQYIEFTSPSGAFGTAKNVIPQLSFDDSSAWTSDTLKSVSFGIHPYVAGLIETNGKAGSGAHLGYYLEPGVNPSVTFGSTGDFPISVSVPIKVGLGFSDFYGGADGKNKFLGYESGGIQLSFPVKFVDATLGGTWSVSAGVAYYHYENGTHAFNVANVGRTNRDDVIGAVGLLCKF